MASWRTPKKVTICLARTFSEIAVCCNCTTLKEGGPCVFASPPRSWHHLLAPCASPPPLPGSQSRPISPFKPLPGDGGLLRATMGKGDKKDRKEKKRKKEKRRRDSSSSDDSSSDEEYKRRKAEKLVRGRGR